MYNAPSTTANIPLSKLLIEARIAYRFTSDISSLQKSILKFGIITPLIVYPVNDKYILLDGFKRLVVLTDANYSEVPVTIIKAKDLLSAFIFTLNIMKETAARLTVLEKASIINVFISYFKITESDLVANYLPLLDLPRKAEVVSLLKTVIQYPDDLKLFLHINDTALNDYYLLRKISISALGELFAFISSFHLSYSNVRQLIELIIEVAIKDDKSIAEVINTASISSMLAQENLQNNIKVARIKDILINLRYPQISEYRLQMESRIKALNLHTGIRFNYPKDAESGDFNVEIKFKTRAEFSRLVDGIVAVNSKTALTDLFEYSDSLF